MAKKITKADLKQAFEDGYEHAISDCIHNLEESTMLPDFEAWYEEEYGEE